MDSKQYDYKEAYNKKLKPSAQLHYLENARYDSDSPATMMQSPVNPVALGGMQPQIPNMFGQPQPGVSYNNLMPQQGSAFQMYDDSPLEGNAFSGALQAAKAKGDDTFQVSGKTYSVK
jgi:hypothetical protein